MNGKMNQMSKSQSSSRTNEWLLTNNLVFNSLHNFLGCEAVFEKNKKNSFSIKYLKYEFIKLYNDIHSNKSNMRYVFVGDILTKEENFYVTNDIIDSSKSSLYDWIFSHMYKIDKNGISINTSFKSKGMICNLKYLYPDYYSTQHIDHCVNRLYLKIYDPFIPLNYTKTSKRSIPLYALFKSNDIILQEYNLNDFSNGVNKLLRFTVLDKKFQLKYKFNEVNGFMFSFTNMASSSILASFRNFPRIVNGHFTLANVLRIKCYDEFPNEIHDNCQFASCCFNNDISLEHVNVHMYKDLIFDNCANEYYFLNALAKSQNVRIDGLIYSKYFTGTLEKLKSILK